MQSEAAVTLDHTRYRAPALVERPLWLLMALGALALVGGALIEPLRTWANALLVSQFVIGVSLGGLFFIAAHHVAGATWPVAFRRVPEAMAGVLPGALLFLGGVLLLGIWKHQYAFHAHVPEGVAHTFGFKELWLHPGFFIARAVFYSAVWLAFAYAAIANSRRQDGTGGTALTARNTRLYAAFLVVFALTFSFASFDWLMALKAEWFSTIFAVYNFSGAFSSALAVLVLALIWCRKRGIMPGACTDDHLHDLGKLLVGFTSFWMYCWFSQYMLIWYSNLPEETLWYVPQMQGAWQPLFILNAVLGWAIPFFVLLPKPAKRSATLMARVAVIVLLGRWLDLYLAIFPALGIEAPSLGPWEIGIAAGAIGAFVYGFGRALRRAPTVPLGDPGLMASMHHHVA